MDAIEEEEKVILAAPSRMLARRGESHSDRQLQLGRNETERSMRRLSADAVPRRATAKKTDHAPKPPLVFKAAGRLLKAAFAPSAAATAFFGDKFKGGGGERRSGKRENSTPTPTPTRAPPRPAVTAPPDLPTKTPSAPKRDALAAPAAEARPVRGSEPNFRVHRRATRRWRGAQAGGQEGWGALAHVRERALQYKLRRESGSSIAEEADTFAATALAALECERLCDVELVASDGVEVRAPRFLLAAHSAVFLEMLYPTEGAVVAGPARRVELAFAGWDAVDVAVRFLITRSLPPSLESTTTELNVRTLCQIHLLGRVYRLNSLVEKVYNKARILINKRPFLACAVFDECRRVVELLSPTQQLSSQVDELKNYALE